MTKKQIKNKVNKIKDNFFYEEKFKKSYYSQKVIIWEKYFKCRVYIPRNAYEQAGYITLDKDDVKSNNSGEYKGIYYQATRPGNISYLKEFIDSLLST